MTYYDLFNYVCYIFKLTAIEHLLFSTPICQISYSSKTSVE